MSSPLNIAFLLVLIIAISPSVAVAQTESFTTQSKRGLQIQAQPQLQPLAINQMHSWTLSLKTADGKAAEGLTITVQGGMPEHDHGLPTQPAIVAETAPGEYSLQGVRFHMPGLWQLNIEISAKDWVDSAVIELSL